MHFKNPLLNEYLLWNQSSPSRGPCPDSILPHRPQGTTHVCRHRRNTIVAFPPPWSSLDNETMRKDLVAAYIDRCGGTPLDINFSSESDKNSSFLKKVVLHSSHIHRIRIPCVPWYHIAEISDAFETPLPLLQDADLSIGYDLSPPKFERPFLAGATNLVSLRLSDYNINSGTPPLHHPYINSPATLVQRITYLHGWRATGTSGTHL